MTIDGLNALTTLTAGDELPVWDVEASAEEPTKKITASNLAASVKSLGNLIGTGDLDSTPTQGSNKAVTSGGTYTAIQQSTASNLTSCENYKASIEASANCILQIFGKMRILTFQGVGRTHTEDEVLLTLPAEHRPLGGVYIYTTGAIGSTSVVIRLNGHNGQITLFVMNGVTASARVYFQMAWVAA